MRHTMMQIVLVVYMGQVSHLDMLAVAEFVGMVQ